MIIWRGFGIVVLGVSIVVAVTLIELSEFLEVDNKLLVEQDWPAGLGMLINGLILVSLGCYLNSKRIREVFRFETFIEDVFDSDHSFFFVAVEYWGVLSLLLALGLFTKQLLV